MQEAAIITKPQNEMQSSLTVEAGGLLREEERGQADKPVIQPRLTVAAAGDPFNNQSSEGTKLATGAGFLQRKCVEQQASSDSLATTRTSGVSFIQRKCAHCEEEEKQVQRKPLPAISQTGSSIIQKEANTPSTPPVTEEYIRDELCVGIPAEGPERAPFNDRQLRWLRAVRSSASWVFSRALTAINARDPYISHLSQSIFQTTNLTWSFLMGKVTEIRDKLASATFELGTCYDSSCRTPGVVAHALPDSNTIVLCRSFFRLNTTQMRRTLIHEAAHNVGIDAQRVAAFRPEFYCREDTESCSEVCNNLNDPINNVDAWAHFIECVAFSF